MKSEPYLEVSGNSGVFTDYNILTRTLDVFCAELSLPKNLWVSLIFCVPEEMKRINRQYRGVDKTTDVLSFPAQPMPVEHNTLESESQFLGEILVDINYIMSQTESSLLNLAVLQVFIHGLLHLVGYDHINSQQKDIMQGLEKSIMDLITREGISGR